MPRRGPSPHRPLAPPPPSPRPGRGGGGARVPCCGGCGRTATRPARSAPPPAPRPRSPAAGPAGGVRSGRERRGGGGGGGGGPLGARKAQVDDGVSGAEPREPPPAAAARPRIITSEPAHHCRTRWGRGDERPTRPLQRRRRHSPLLHSRSTSRGGGICPRTRCHRRGSCARIIRSGVGAS
jgi:hypothetical protein